MSLKTDGGNWGIRLLIIIKGKKKIGRRIKATGTKIQAKLGIKFLLKKRTTVSSGSWFSKEIPSGINMKADKG